MQEPQSFRSYGARRILLSIIYKHFIPTGFVAVQSSSQSEELDLCSQRE